MAKKEEVVLASRFHLLSAFVLLVIAGPSAHAEVTILGPVSITLPGGWSCQTQELNYICLDNSAGSEKDVALVVSFKKKSPEDLLPVYKDQLSRSRNLHQGEIVLPSQPRGVREMTLNGHVWIEGIHLGSEVPNYFTHYYATVADPYAVLVSLSIDKNTYDKKWPAMKNVVESIRLSTGAGLTTNQMAGVSPQAMPTQAVAQKPGRIDILGYNVPKGYLYVGAGLIVVLGLLLYALKI